MTVNSIIVDYCLFDLDGTIVSTTYAAEKAWRKLCKLHNVDADELFRHSHGSRSNEMLARFFPNLDNTDNKAVIELETSMANDYLESVSLIPGSEDLLKSLDKNTESGEKVNPRKWAIVTSGSPNLAFSWFFTILKDIGKPDVFITAFNVKNGKPDPEGYQSAANQLCDKLHKQFKNTKTVVFEDAPVGIKAGKSIGAYTIGITSTYDKQVLIDAGADFIVKDLTAVKIVKNTDGGITIQIDNNLK